MSKIICKLVKKKIPKEDPDEYREMIHNAEYFCRNCGLVSNKKTCLCKPEPIQTKKD